MSDQRIAELENLLALHPTRTAALLPVAEFLRASGNYRWVGLYEVDHAAGEVRNLIFSGVGAPAFPTFSIEKGLTSAAIRERCTINVGDTASDPRYLTAFGSTRSEIIVPILDRAGEKVIGTIDVESEQPNAFSPIEQSFLEQCAELLRPLWSSAL